MTTNTNSLWMSGNEAIAMAAYEAGVKVASGYPGTPSTEIMENLSKYEGVYTEWAPNEKVGLEVAIGASFAGVRALATMKHVGLNVAADPLFTVSYTGVRGGLVIITADDPEMHSSQNEQDNRNYAYAAKLPMLEPSDPAEAKEMLKEAFELSERLDTPVLFRITTRISHVKGIVEKGEMMHSHVECGIEKSPAKFVMLPALARKRRKVVEERMIELTKIAESNEYNRVEAGDKKRGFITSGVSYLYVKEAFPEAAVLKLGMCWPLPENEIKAFAATVDELFVVEELDPFLEHHIKAMGVACRGKDCIPNQGELNTSIVRASIDPDSVTELFPPADLPMRPPNMCAGCPHRGVFFNLSKMKDVFVSGDIGCKVWNIFRVLYLRQEYTRCSGDNHCIFVQFQRLFQRCFTRFDIMGIHNFHMFYPNCLTEFLNINGVCCFPFDITTGCRIILLSGHGSDTIIKNDENRSRIVIH